MASSNESKRAGFGIVLTFLWLSLVVAYVFLFVGHRSFLEMKPNEHGDFFAGVFAPIAFLWLVIGYMQQGAELRANTNALAEQAQEARHAAEQAKIQAEGIKANEEHARRDTFYRMVELIERELVYHSSQLLASIDASDFSEKWDQYGNGDPFVFQRTVCDKILYGADMPGEMALRESQRTAIRRYCRIFEKILQGADTCDDAEKNLRGQFEWSPNGELYAVFCKIMGRTSKLVIAKHHNLVSKVSKVDWADEGSKS